MGEKVVCFKSSTLRTEDVMLFREGGWLNDQCINFYYEYLSEKYGDQCLFMDPATVFLIQCIDDVNELKNCLGALKLHTDLYIFCPVNDNTEPDSSKGSHWTLLIYAGPHSCLYYYDSTGCLPTNKQNALNVGIKLSQILEQSITKLYRVGLANPQSNGSDCGVYVLLLSQLIAKGISQGKDRDATQLIGLQDWISPESASKLRKHIQKLIEKMRVRI